MNSELAKELKTAAEGLSTDQSELYQLLVKASEEIEFLRGILGAVSQGKSLSDYKKDIEERVRDNGKNS